MSWSKITIFYTLALNAPVRGILVTFCDSTLNTANLCPAISIVGLFYLFTVMYTVVWFGILVHLR